MKKQLEQAKQTCKKYWMQLAGLVITSLITGYFSFAKSSYDDKIKKIEENIKLTEARTIRYVDVKHKSVIGILTRMDKTLIIMDKRIYDIHLKEIKK